MNWLTTYQQRLTKQIQTDKLPHALLISGVKHSGKNKLADWLGRIIACQSPILDSQNVLNSCQQCKHCLLVNGDTYPDLHLLQSEKNSHKVDDIRKISQYLQKTPQLGNYQVVTIENAHHMNASASNALLKTLEEPTASSVLVLLTDNKSQLLETVISRCQSIDIKPYVGRELAAQYNVEIENPYLNLTHLSQINSQEIRNQYVELQNHFIDFVLGQYSLVQLASEIVNNEEGYSFLQQNIATLMREANGWYSTDEQMNYRKIEHCLSQSSLFKVNTLLLSLVALNQQVQTNRQLQTEKFLVSVQQLINKNKK